MVTKIFRKSVSIALVLVDDLPYDGQTFQAMLRSAVEQDHGDVEILVVDGRKAGEGLDPKWVSGLNADLIRVVPAEFTNRARLYNAAISAAKGDYLLMVFNLEHSVVLKRSAVRTMVMAAERCGDTAFVYSDYELISAAGDRTERHLLDWHEGRLLDTADFGAAMLFPASLLRDAGGFDEKYKAADAYDARLKATEGKRAVHIANRYAGSLYAIHAADKAHNVFDYLLMGKDAQKEMEAALSAHLKRTGAYLEPGAHLRQLSEVKSAPADPGGIIASVVIPVNRRPEFIGRAIESVQKQTNPNVEVIVVVNGGESDPTSDAVRRHMEGGDLYDPAAPPVRLIVVDVNNLGLCLNSGIAAARGQYYVQLDSDDRLKPDAVEKILAVYKSDPTVGMVIGSYEVWVLDEKSGEVTRDERVPVVTHDEWTADNGRNNLLRIGGAGAPRSAHVDVIADAGWFGVNDDPQCRNYGEDYDLVLRISERYTIGRVWDPIYEVIRHAGGTDHSIDRVTIDRNEAAKDFMRLHALARRKRLNGSAKTSSGNAH